ncbi:MAG TPA: hypothetical protein VIM71_05835 [Lacunisphaera sp.]
MKPGFIGLLFFMVVSSTLSGSVKSQRADILPLKLDLPPVPVAFMPVPCLPLSVTPRRLEPIGALCGGTSVSPLFFGCGHSHDFILVERKSKLQNPLAALGAAFSKCHAVTSEVLAPWVPVADYPEGYFGGWIQDGILVTERHEFTDEAAIRRIFTFLAAAIDSQNDNSDYDFEIFEPDPTLAEYRRETGFVPELTFRFVGEVTLRAEINQEQGRLLIQAGDQWDVYSLDRWSMVALKELLAASTRVDS